MSTSSGSESSGGHSDVRIAKSEDSGWLHGCPIDNDRQKPQCRYCDKQMKSGGITRLKQHFAGRYSNVAKCKSCLSVVFAQMRELLKDTKAMKSDKKRREGRFNKILFNEDTFSVIPISDSDDDMIYLVDYDILEDRECIEE